MHEPAGGLQGEVWEPLPTRRAFRCSCGVLTMPQKKAREKVEMEEEKVEMEERAATKRTGSSPKNENGRGDKTFLHLSIPYCST